MADFQQKNDIDLRFGGSTLGDFGYFYDVELPWLYNCINSIRRNQASPSSEVVEPVANQMKVEDNKIYFRDSSNTEWIYIGDVSFNLGMRDSDEEEFLTDSDIWTTGDKPGKLVAYNEDGVIVGDVTGGAAKLAGKRVDMSSISDGQVPVFREATNTWVGEAKGGALGDGKALTLKANGKLIGTYDGSAVVELDIPEGMLLRETEYAVGDVVSSPELPWYQKLECITAGTTAETLPAAIGG